MRAEQDAFGQAMLDYLHGRGGYEVVERDDGFVSIGAGPDLYFAEYDRWREPERQAMSWVSGRVLDVGCGAGRFMLWLRDRGFEVTGIDPSPGAVETCRLRGLTDVRVASVEAASAAWGCFDTVLMLGGNLGLLGSPERAHRILRRLHRETTPDGRIIGASRDRRASGDPDALSYTARNLELGVILVSRGSGSVTGISRHRSSTRSAYLLRSWANCWRERVGHSARRWVATGFTSP